MKTIKAYLCGFGCGKFLRSRSGMRRHQKECYWNPITRSCASCGNQEKETVTVYNPNHGGNPGSTDYEKDTSTCSVFGTNLRDYHKLRTGCKSWIESIPESIRIPMMKCKSYTDFPTAWAIQEDMGESLKHGDKCSSVPGWHRLSGPGLLCDCGAVEEESKRLRKILLDSLINLNGG